MPCFCEQHPYQRLQGDDPGRIPGIVIDEDNARFPASLVVSCVECGTRWRVLQIPYGGIYGDFDWERLAD